MMYVGDEPWHGLGTKLNAPATAAQAIEAAHLDWEVVKRPLHVIGNGTTVPVKGKFAMLPADRLDRADCPVFGVVSGEYTPLQNREAFAFFDSIVGQDAAVYHTAGALGRGERVWILAKLPTSIRVIGDDIAEKYLLLSNGHDGESSVQIKFTPIRVVCQNTLTMAMGDGEMIRVAHRPDMPERLEYAKRLLGFVDERYERIEKAFQRMVQVRMNSQRVEAYFREVLPLPVRRKRPSVGRRQAERAEQRRRRVLESVRRKRALAQRFFEDGKGNTLPRVRGTLWAAYNGVTEMIDHNQTGLNAERRLNSIWFGEGFRVKARAYGIAVAAPAKWN